MHNFTHFDVPVDQESSKGNHVQNLVVVSRVGSGEKYPLKTGPSVSSVEPVFRGKRGRGRRS